MGVPLRGVPEADEEGDDAEVEEAATVLVCRGLGAALRWDLEGRNEDVSWACSKRVQVQEGGSAEGGRTSTNLFPRSNAGLGLLLRYCACCRPTVGLSWAD